MVAMEAEKYFLVEPEVAGGLGPNTVMDPGVHPPVVSRLHYEFYGWLGDVLLETFPCFIVTEDARQRLVESHFSGARFDEVEISASEQFEELYPGVELPRFAWLRVIGEAGKTDFGTITDGRLVMSARALDVLRSLGLSHAAIEPILPSH